MNSSNRNVFEIAGSTTDQIDVKISHRIIQLFSEGLYSSPNKAVEELISNSFDAGAQNVHIILSPDLKAANATIVVIDDGEGMNNEDLKKHWIIGESTRRRGTSSSRRNPIGKFGIGKLSTFVLASKLTHISKSCDTYYAATMDYTNLASSVGEGSKGVFDEQTIKIPLRILTEQEAQDAILPWTLGTKEGYKVLRLFGDNANPSWTVAIMSGLKEMGKKIKIGRLKWILQTAMPQRGDFHLFLDGDPISPPEIDEPIAKLVIGKDVIQMPKPCPEGLIGREDISELEDSIHRYGVYQDRLLGRISGYIEIFKDELDAGKERFGQSNGFFVYVRGRQVNVDDLGFGIERNLLRHGTFSRFRMVVHIDSLDEALRSSRESFQQGDLYKEAQNFLRAGFNLARNKLVEYDRLQSPAALISARISSAPGSMTRRPLLALAQMVAEKKATPYYLRFPSGLSDKEQTEFLEELKQQAEGADGLLRSTELSALDSKDGFAIFDIQQGKLLINSSHPFVAAFQEFFADARRNLPLEMFAMSEILMEAHFYYMGLDESVIRDVIGRRDELLRQFVRSSARRTAGMIALALTEARDDENKLEEEMRSAFEAMGFANVIRIGGSGKPDGTAEAHLAAAEDGTVQRYKVGLEAKSGQSVSALRLNISGIARHMQDYNCDHHLVIGNGFATSTGEDSASVREINTHKRNTGKTITLMHIDDLARLIRVASAKRVGGLSHLRNLFRNCVTPEESKLWVDNLAAQTPENWPYIEILGTIWHLAEEQPNEAVEYAAVITELRHCTPAIRMNKQDLIECCKAMQVMARGVVFARENTVEIDRRPDLILEDIRAAVGEYPEEERRTIHI
ncbi:MAG: ATP-binding protein [Bacteroidales bacterium]|nr:ATP-binding protein [Bacteroidales bacterium]